MLLLFFLPGPGRPAHNAHPQSCSGEPIPPAEVVKRERDKKEKKLRKQLERQAKRLQQSKQKPGVNTATLVEAIQQSLAEIRAVNYGAKQPENLIGRELYSILIDALGVECCTEMLKKVFSMSPGSLSSAASCGPPPPPPSSHHHHRSSPPPLNFSNFNAAAAAAAAAAVAAAANLNGGGKTSVGGGNNFHSPSHHHHHHQSPGKANPFSIDNLLSSRHVPGSLLTAAAVAAAAASITQPVGFMVNNVNKQIATKEKNFDHYDDDEDVDIRSENDEDIEEEEEEEDELSNCSFRSNNSIEADKQRQQALWKENHQTQNDDDDDDEKAATPTTKNECNATDLFLLDKEDADTTTLVVDVGASHGSDSDCSSSSPVSSSGGGAQQHSQALFKSSSLSAAASPASVELEASN